MPGHLPGARLHCVFPQPYQQKMGEQITNAEWEKISPDNFETASLLRAVDAIDDLRGDFNDGEYSAPPQIRTDLLRLHEIAMAVINEGSRSRVSALFELASDLDEQISHLVNRLDEVQDTLSQLMELYPESLYYDDIEGVSLGIEKFCALSDNRCLEI
ncbi:transposase [Klebsiella quasipneumoniae]|nr:transposase [Klebsiella quasipneumoniae]